MLKNKKLLFHSDNQSVVYILNSMTSKSDSVMILVRMITMECLRHNMVIKGKHILGTLNVLSDCLSRSCLQKFRQLAPEAEPQPAAVPDHLWKVFD